MVVLQEGGADVAKWVEQGGLAVVASTAEKGTTSAAKVSLIAASRLKAARSSLIFGQEGSDDDMPPPLLVSSDEDDGPPPLHLGSVLRCLSTHPAHPSARQHPTHVTGLGQEQQSEDADGPPPLEEATDYPYLTLHGQVGT